MQRDPEMMNLARQFAQGGGMGGMGGMGGAAGQSATPTHNEVV